MKITRVAFASLAAALFTAAPAHAQWSLNGVKVFYTAGNVGIGTNNPAHQLDVRSPGARAISGTATAGSGTRHGVYGQANSTAGIGVYGLANASSGTNYGVYGKTNSNNGYAGYFEGGRNYMQGRLGLGTKNPSQRLHVAGNAKVTGWIGTDGNAPVELRSHNKTVLRLRHITQTNPVSLKGVNMIGGHETNSIADGAIGATIGGGGGTVLNINQGNTIGANGSYATISGGHSNNATADSAAIAGGNYNTASGNNSFVGAGTLNTAAGASSVVPGGISNVAGGGYSFAAGRRAKANHEGSFVWGDATNDDVASSAANQFTVRSSGGARFFSSADLNNGVTLAAGGGSWQNLSDRNAKENFEKVDGRAILERLAALPMMTWNYKSQDASIRHIGPTAQDFHAAFGIGEDQTRITTTDADGVALAAIQGLHLMLKEREAEIASLRQEKDAQLQALMERLNLLEAKLASHE
jgi:hypothetical protein